MEQKYIIKNKAGHYLCDFKFDNKRLKNGKYTGGYDCWTQNIKDACIYSEDTGNLIWLELLERYNENTFEIRFAD